MRIALSTHGTRGDLQPFSILARALTAAGHDVVLGAPPNLMDFVRRCGVEVEHLAIDSQEFLESDAGRRWLASGNVRRFMAELGKVMSDHSAELIEDLLRITKGADLIVGGQLTEDHLSTIAEARGVPFASVQLAPIRPTRDFASALLTVADVPTAALRLLTHRIVEREWWKGYKRPVAGLRERLGLPADGRTTPRRMAERRWPAPHAISPTLMSAPSDWDPALLPVLGHITVPAELRSLLGEDGLPVDLREWLAAGPPPVFFGMGSMPVLDPAAAVGQVTRIAERAGIRAVIGAGWSRLDTGIDDARVRVVGSVNHELLFPRCRAAVHHGGAGTTHAALAAGLPSLVSSVFADQPFWGSRVERLGAGVHLPFKRWNEDSVGAALERVLAPETRAAATAAAASMAHEPDGTAALVARLEALLG